VNYFLVLVCIIREAKHFFIFFLSEISNGKTYILTLLTKLNLNHDFLKKKVMITLEWLTILHIFNIFFRIMEKKTEN